MKPTNLSEDCERVDALQLFQGFLPVQPHLLFFFLLAAVFCGSCSSLPEEKDCPPEDRPEEPEEVIITPVLDLYFRDCSRVFDDAVPRIFRVDIFIYKDEELKTLETYERINIHRKYTVESSAGKKIIVALANVPGTFGLSSLQRFENLCQIEMDFNRDDPLRPVMSGILSVEAPDSGKVCVELPLEPLMSRIIVERIDNSLGGYATADRPVLTLTGAATGLPLIPDGHLSAGQRGSRDESGIIPQGDFSISIPLPSDIGPDGCQLWQSIYYYPPADSLRLDFLVNGEKRSTSIALPAAKNNSTEIVSLEIE